MSTMKIKPYFVTLVRDQIGIRVIVDEEYLHEESKIPTGNVTFTLVEHLGMTLGITGNGEELNAVIKAQGANGLHLVEPTSDIKLEVWCYYVDSIAVSNNVHNTLFDLWNQMILKFHSWEDN